ncbi:MAG TPA: tetratricopeptide repeat protein, partial [Anaerolineae bacterium]|nr:tetratricopeptide repeat protein [Anaerolineae bacterium]
MKHTSSRGALPSLHKTKPMVLLTVGLVAVSVLLQAQVLTLPFPWLQVISCALALFLLPGYLFARVVLGAESSDPLELLGISFVLGLVLQILLATVLPLLRGTLDMLIAASIGMQLVLAALAVWRGSRGGQRASVFAESLRSLGRVNLLVLVLFVVVLVLVIRAQFPAIVHESGDSWVYLQVVRRYLDMPHLDPTDPLLGNEIHPRLLLTGWLALEALISRISSVDPLSLHSIYLPPILVLASFLSLYSLAKGLFGTSEGGMVACLVQAVYVFSGFLSEASEGVPGAMRGIGFSVLRRMAEDKTLCWQILLPILILWAVRFLSTGSRGHWVAWVLAAAAVTVVHPTGWVYLVLSVGSFLLVHMILGPGRRKWLRALAVVVPVVALSVVPVAQQIMAAAKLPMYFDFWYDVAADARYYVEIMRLLSHPLTLLALAMTPLLLPFLRGHRAARYAFSNMAVPLLAIANPLTKFLLTDVLDTAPLVLVMRSLRVLPVSLTISFFVCQLSVLIRERFGRRPARRWSRLAKDAVPVALLAVMAVSLTPSIRAGISYMPVLREERELHRDEKEVLEHLAGALQQESTVWLDDAQMGLRVYAYSIHAVVTDQTVYERLLRPIDPATRLKIEDEDGFFARNLVTESSLKAVVARDVAIIVVNNDNPLACQLARLPGMFSETLRNPTYSVFAVTPDQPMPEAVAGNTSLHLGDPERAVSIYSRALANDPEDILSLFGRGIAFWYLGDVVKADRDLSAATEIASDERCRAP